MLSSGISNQVFYDRSKNLNKTDRETLQLLADISYNSYQEFKSHPLFVPYLEEMSTLNYYAKTNIGSRPSKRPSDSEGFDFENLRAIPFVGGWSQLKQNVPGFYGLGSALNYFEKNNNFDKINQLFIDVPFFRALISNSMMSLKKSFFELTLYLKLSLIHI